MKPLAKFAIVIVGFGLVGGFIGALSWLDYLSGLPQPKPHGETGILLGYHPIQDVTEIGLGLSANPVTRSVSVTVHMTLTAAGNYSYMMTLPYHIVSKSSYDDVDWNVIKVGSGSIIIARFSHQAVGDPRTLRATFVVEEPIAQSNFGSYSIDIPLGGSISNDLSEEIEKLPVRVPIVGSGAHYYDVSLAIPSTATITSSTHEIYRRNFFNQNGIEMQGLWLRIKSLEPIFVQYVLPGETHRYQRDALFTGLFMGMGIPLMVTGFFEYARETHINGRNQSGSSTESAQNSFGSPNSVFFCTVSCTQMEKAMTRYYRQVI